MRARRPSGARVGSPLAHVRLACFRRESTEAAARIEGSLGLVLPGVPDPVRRSLAHTRFAATHGIVVLGLERKLGTVSREDIAWRIALLIRATVTGLPCDGVPEPRGSS